MKNIFLNLVYLITIFLYSTAQADTALDLLKASDRARGGVVDGIQWETQVTTYDAGSVSEREFRVTAQNTDARVEAIKPAKFKGEVYIFNDRNMWFFKPSLKKPISISARQKLTGQTANGDIASTNYARDYSPTIEKTEIVDGEKLIVLMLQGKSKNLTYDKIRYWINEKSKLAVKAEFLTIQGSPFKLAQMKYNEKIKINGQTLPFVSELTISDAKFPQNKSIIKYSSPQIKSVSSALFNVNNLTR